MTPAGTNLENLTVRLGGNEREEETARRRPDGNGRGTAFLGLEAGEHASDALVEHQGTVTFTLPSSTVTSKVSTGM